MDVIQPWNVGRLTKTKDVQGWWGDDIIADVERTQITGQMYMPVIFPGFAWSNKKDAPRNQIPREGGDFLWQQAAKAIASGVNMLKIAMFDEVDEATAMFKIASNSSETPDEGYWLSLDADGNALPSDWYLRLAGEITSMMRGDIPFSQSITINPNDDYTPAPTSAKSAAKIKAVEFNYTYSDLGQNIVFSGDEFSRVEIMNVQGHTLNTIFSNNQNKALWNKRDVNGNQVPLGLYLVKITGKNPQVVMKVFLVKKD